MIRLDRSRFQPLRRQVLDLVEEFRHHWLRVRLPGLSAEIAFYALLGLFPAVLLFAGMLGSLDAVIGAGAAADIEGWLLDRVSETFGADSTLRGTVTDLFTRSNASVITLGAVLTLYASSRGFIAVVRALDVTYGHEHRRRWLATRLVGFGITIVTVVVAALVAVMVVLGPLLGSGEDVAERLGRGDVFAAAWVWLRWPLVAVAVVLWAATLYHVAPRRRSSWRHELPGAAVATAWWLVASTAFRVYIDLASSGMNTVFGLLGGVLSLLFWLYLLAMGLLVGAVVNSLLAGRRRSVTPGEAPAQRPGLARDRGLTGEHRLGGERHPPLQGLVEGAAPGDVDQPLPLLVVEVALDEDLAADPDQP